MARARRRATGRTRGRKRPFRSPKPRVLILCEARATEPNYFNALKLEMGLTTVVVKKGLALHPSPGGGRANDLTSAARDALRNDFDEVWCVVDHDDRDEAIRGLRNRLGDLSTGPHERVFACVSAPCFEYWLLLHFEFTNQRFVGMPGGAAACEQVIRLLRKHLQNYAKNDARVYERCSPRLDEALVNSKRIPADQANPNTDVGKLVERLRRLAAGTESR